MAVSIADMAERELEERKVLFERIMTIVFDKYELGLGWAHRGQLQSYVFETLGFAGNRSNDFGVFMNKVLLEHGIRAGIRKGKYCYYGINLKGVDCRYRKRGRPRKSADDIAALDDIE